MTPPARTPFLGAIRQKRLLSGQLNRRFRVMKLTVTEIQQIASEIAESLHPQQVLLFGSYAEGTATDDSDLDLLIIMQSGEPRYKRSASVRKLFWPPKTAMDILVYTPEEVARWNGVPNHVLTNAYMTGKVLYAA